LTAPQQHGLGLLVDQLQRGELTEESLRRGVADIVGWNGQGVQDLLYLQAASSAPAAQVVGMMWVEGGQVKELPPDPDDWPYQTVLAAISDRWSVISFPEMSLLTMSDKEFHGLGFQFILERRS
jgi:hypothetical protein